MNKSARAFPDAIDGTPHGTLTEREEQQERANDKELSRKDMLLNQDMDDLVAYCKEQLEETAALEDERKAVNAEITAIRANLEKRGVSKKAFSAALTVSKLKDDEMDGYDFAVAVLRKAMNRPVETLPQMDMFENEVNSEGDEAA